MSFNENEKDIDAHRPHDGGEPHHHHQQAVEVTEIIIIELVDIEECAKRGEPPLKAKKYRIRINKQYYVVDVPKMTGREILKLAGKVPANQYKLQQKLTGGRVEVIDADQVVNFTKPGIERFQWFPLTETEG